LFHRVARRHAFLGHTDSGWQLRAAVGEQGVVGVDAPYAPSTDADRSEMFTLTQAMDEARRLWLANDSWTRRRRALELVGIAYLVAAVNKYGSDPDAEIKDDLAAAAKRGGDAVKKLAGK